MPYRSVKGYSGLNQFAYLMLFIGLGFILAAIVQLFIGFQMVPKGTSFENMGEAMIRAMTKPENVGLARMAQVTGTLCLLFIPALLFTLVVHGRNPHWLGFSKYINAKQILIGFAIIFLANILASPLADFSKWILLNFPSLDAMAAKLEKTYEDQVVALSNLTSWPEYLMAIVIMAFFPALFEELFFRGVLQNLFERWWKMPLLAILITSILFSLIHSSIYLFLSRVVLGFALGMMFHISKNIWVNVFAHFINNAIAVTQLFYMGLQKKSVDPAALDPKLPWWSAVLALVVMLLLFRFLERFSTENRQKITYQEEVILAKEDIYKPFDNREII